MPKPSSKPFTVRDLELLETRIRAGLAAFVDAGKALAQVRDSEGWRLRGYRSFEQYCQKEFGFSIRHGQRLIAAAQIINKVEQATGEMIRNESVARALRPVALAHDSGVAIRAVQTELRQQGQSIATATAEVVAKVVKQIAPPQPRVYANPPPPITNTPMYDEAERAERAPIPLDGTMSMRDLHAAAFQTCSVCEVRTFPRACVECPGVKLLRNLLAIRATETA